MSKEICEQPQALTDTLDALLPSIATIQDLARDVRHVLFIARGSSDNAAVYGRTLCEVHAAIPASLASPSTATVYRQQLDLKGVLAVAISQSGETQEIVETMAWAADCGARTIAITNNEASSLSSAADIALATKAGPELAVPATKTYTAQLLALAVLGHSLSQSKELEAHLRDVPDEAARVLLAADQAATLAESLIDVDSVVMTGRGFTQSTALEIALKMKEACYINASGLSLADLLHGPIAVLDATTPLVLFAPDGGPTIPGLIALAQRASEIGASTYAIGGPPELGAACSLQLPGTDLPEALAPITLAIPGQVMVETLARLRGIDPDQPRTLSKVTQT
jgi:glucosamine--fructose-6-phosphate aminotransferase (isomerizing)